MPHCVIEYASELADTVSAKAMVEVVQKTVEASDLFNAADVRSRAIAYDAYQLGAEQSKFLHVTVKLLAGRTDEQKAQLNEEVLQQLSQLAISDALLSCECVDIHTESYQKMVL